MLNFSPPLECEFKIKNKLCSFSVLNGCTRRGPFVANSLGVLALMYSTLDYGIGKLREKDDQYNSIAAAVTTGVIFKSTGIDCYL